MPCPGSSVGGHDESPGDHAATDAADPPAAGAFPSAAPGPAPAAAGCYATAGWLYTQHLSILFVFLTNKKKSRVLVLEMNPHRSAASLTFSL